MASKKNLVAIAESQHFQNINNRLLSTAVVPIVPERSQGNDVSVIPVLLTFHQVRTQYIGFESDTKSGAI